jgi:hypothetical protein
MKNLLKVIQTIITFTSSILGISQFNPISILAQVSLKDKSGTVTIQFDNISLITKEILSIIIASIEVHEHVSHTEIIHNSLVIHIQIV